MSATITTPEDCVRARKCWRTLEPYHGFIYFAPEATEEYEALGVTGRSGYFFSRSAAMGRVRAATVQATFFNFQPELVTRAMAEVPDDVSADDMLAARLRAADRVIRAKIGDDVDSPGMRRAVELTSLALDAIGPTLAGRPLAAAHAALPTPDEPHLALWTAISTLREYRGDGHVAALVDAELAGLDALILHGATAEVGADVLQETRAWSDEEWADGVARLATRGLVDAEGAFTPAGAELRQTIEDRTDRLAAPAWAALTDDEASELRSLVRPWSKAIFAF